MMNKKLVAVAIATSVVTTQAFAFGGWLGKQLDNMSNGGSGSNKQQIDQMESRIQGNPPRTIPGQPYRIVGTHAVINRVGGSLVNIDPPTGEHYIVIVDDDPAIKNHVYAISVNCNTYQYRHDKALNEYITPTVGKYNGAFVYAACHIQPGT